MMFAKPWVSFCMSTYKRADLLKQQLHSLSQQTFKNFEVIISDNDPEESAKEVVTSTGDVRFKYYSNGENLGMMKSFNKSIERSSADYIVMITDDDPVQKNFLYDMYGLYEQNKSYGVYAGFIRKNTRSDEIEYLNKDIFAAEILNTRKTPNILWSSCIIEKAIANGVGRIPDFGSPHLADHAFIAMCGSIKGGVIINRMFGTFTSHNANFSKSNFESYIRGCTGFYNTLINHFKPLPYFSKIKTAINIHLRYWLIINIFSLKKYYSGANKNRQMLHSIHVCAQKLLQLPFMKKFRSIYYTKNIIFHTKKALGFYTAKSNQL